LNPEEAITVSHELDESGEMLRTIVEIAEPNLVVGARPRSRYLVDAKPRLVFS